VNWQNQVGVVTGATSGIGRAIALSFATRGMTVVVIGRDSKRLEEVAAQARARAPRVFAYRADLSEDEEIHRLRDELHMSCGAIDVLVHSVGAFHMAPIEETPVMELDRLYRTNVRAPYALTQALLPMVRSQQGQIVFINSSVGLAAPARANLAAYSATKYALRAIADALRAEVNADGVRVLSVYPGRTATPQQEAIHALEGKPYRPEMLMQPEDVATAVVDALSVARTAEVTDVSIRPLRKT
jgi:short-subunit dehydrogenase